MNYFQKNKGRFFSTLIILLSFSLMSFHPKKNFRIEKRHYRKGYYVDIWSHPHTQPQTVAQTSVAVETKQADTPTAANEKSEKTTPTSAAVQTPAPTAAPEQNSNQSTDSKQIIVEPNGASRSTDDGGKQIQAAPTRNAPVSIPQKPIAPHY